MTSATRPVKLYFFLTAATLAAAAFFLAHANDEDPYVKAREQFLQAHAQAGVDLQDSETLQAYPLYPYLQAARLKYALENASAAPSEADIAVAKFLQDHAADPVGSNMRSIWLHSLARRNDWTTFLKQYLGDNSDVTLRCQYLGATIAALPAEGTLDPAVEKDLIETWLTPRRLPEECEAPFSWARQRNIVTADHIEKRVRLALENDQAAFARDIAARLPAERSAPLIQWTQLLLQPEKSLDALIADPKKSVEPAALLAGWSKLARRNTAAALKRYDSLITARKLDAAQASPFALQLALGLAWNRQPEALSYFSRVRDADFDDYALSWQARAALWAEDWKQVMRTIERMSATQREETRWRYWLARAAEQTGNTVVAREQYAGLLPKDNYYSAVAAARLDKTAHPHPQQLPSTEAQLKAIESQPAFVRARELLRCQFRNEALAEWRYGVNQLTADLKPQAIHVASLWGWYDISVTTATQQRLFNDYALLYPQPYDESVESAAQLTALELPLIYGIIRQESLFRPDAVSPVGAMGLTQLMPETARHTARHWKRDKPTRADLFDPDVNVSLGAGQLRILVDRFDGQIPVALAGYNAGPNAAKRWLPDKPRSADIWIENIPYNETREYVQRVLWHSVVFAWLKSGEAQDTSAWLGSIAPLGTAL